MRMKQKVSSGLTRPRETRRLIPQSGISTILCNQEETVVTKQKQKGNNSVASFRWTSPTRRVGTRPLATHLTVLPTT